jgi:hypothetical protein
VVKSLALGVSSTYTAWLFLIAARGKEGVENYIELLKIEMQMLTSASAFERCQCGRRLWAKILRRCWEYPTSTASIGLSLVPT